MRQVNERDAVRNIQRYLRRLSYTDPSIPPVAIDGIFEDTTRNSLMAFQKKNGLNESGVADKESLDALYESYLQSVNRYTPPSGFSVFPRNLQGHSIGVGEVSFAVSSIQFLLGEIAAIQDTLGEVAITGRYDIETSRAVAIFQAATNLLVTGEVDLATWQMLVDTYENHGKDYSQ